MQTVSKSALKAKMLQYFRNIEESGEELLVTNNGKPVLKVIPFQPLKTCLEVFGSYQGKVKYHGDLLENTSDEWKEV
jgi:antitoxin (DNA-binding transcriptional repressor) of toxin-antitoxin stability system